MLLHRRAVSYHISRTSHLGWELVDLEPGCSYLLQAALHWITLWVAKVPVILQMMWQMLHHWFFLAEHCQPPKLYPCCLKQLQDYQANILSKTYSESFVWTNNTDSYLHYHREITPQETVLGCWMCGLGIASGVAGDVAVDPELF